MERPCVLLVPQLTEMEWERTRPLIEEWADVASFDAPGVGGEPSGETGGRQAMVERALRELDARGWRQWFVVGDSWAGPTAVEVAQARPEAVLGLALGHPALRHPAVNEELYEAVGRLIDADYRAFVTSAIAQLTQGSYDREWVDRMIERVPAEVARETWTRFHWESADVGAILHELRKPLLLAAHEGCIAVEPEVFDDMVAAFPEARTVSTTKAPATSPAFAEALRNFCLQR